MEDKAKLFEKGEYNALANAIVLAAEAKDFKDENYEIYDFLEKTPKTSMVIEIVDSLHKFGYKIVKK